MMEARARRAVMSDVVARNMLYYMLEPRVVHSLTSVVVCLRRMHLRNMCIFMKYANGCCCTVEGCCAHGCAFLRRITYLPGYLPPQCRAVQ